MPRFHFNVRDGKSFPDVEGHELPGIEAAKREAVTLSGDLLREMGETFWNGEQWEMEVTDERGLILFTLVFLACLAPATKGPTLDDR